MASSPRECNLLTPAKMDRAQSTSRSAGGSTSRSCSSSLSSPRSRGGVVSHVNRSGGAGVISQDEAAQVLKHVSRKCAALEDEEQLAQMSRELALQEKAEAKNMKAVAKAKEEELKTARSLAADGAASASPSKSKRSRLA